MLGLAKPMIPKNPAMPPSRPRVPKGPRAPTCASRQIHCPAGIWAQDLYEKPPVLVRAASLHQPAGALPVFERGCLWCTSMMRTAAPRGYATEPGSRSRSPLRVSPSVMYRHRHWHAQPPFLIYPHTKDTGSRERVKAHDRRPPPAFLKTTASPLRPSSKTTGAIRHRRNRNRNHFAIPQSTHTPARLDRRPAQWRARAIADYPRRASAGRMGGVPLRRRFPLRRCLD